MPSPRTSLRAKVKAILGKVKAKARPDIHKAKTTFVL